MTERLKRVLARIDAVNALDPVQAEVSAGSISRSVLYGMRMSEALALYLPAASEHLQIAARAQHIERWIVPRESYPEGRIGYLRWRKDLQRHHASRTGELMHAEGYGEADVARAGELLRKEMLKLDPEVQDLEDVTCLVFLRYEASEFIARYPDDKVRDILGKTARKMSARGLQAARQLALTERLARLLAEALAPD